MQCNTERGKHAHMNTVLNKKKKKTHINNNIDYILNNNAYRAYRIMNDL